MTGFGSAEASHGEWTLKAECRSVNHRGLDVRVWSPREWAWVEPFVLAAAREALRRGRVEVRVDVAPNPQGGAAAGGQLNRAAFASVAAELTEAATSAGLPGPTTADVLTFDDVRRTTAHSEAPDDHAPYERVILDALDALAASRQSEGQRLRATMDELLAEASRRVASIGAHARDVADEYRTKLEQRLREALDRFEVGELDERSILGEVALYADRSDISEELQRATSHVEKLREVFAEADEPIGKQVDFYLQEFFREANTMGSKSGSLAITDDVIALKTALEKMREQAANIE